LFFSKPFDQLALEDINALQAGRIHESDILDYKKGMIDDDGLLKHVSAFANTRGGIIIFGVEETGPGGYPKDICGIEQLNHERLEQIILSNIAPRLTIRIKIIPNTPRNNNLLLMEIPDSHLKPHMNLRSKKFYRRYNFEAVEMSETEVSEAYKTRFEGYRDVSAYVERVIVKYPGLNDIARVIIQPTVITELIDTSRPDEFKWLDPSNFDPEPVLMRNHFTFLPNYPEPSADGVLCQTQGLLRAIDSVEPPYIELHRNGCIEYGSPIFNIPNEIPWVTVAIKMMHLFQFASIVYSRYNYFGDVRIVLQVRSSSNGVTLGGVKESRRYSGRIRQEREVPSTILGTHFSQITAGMMHQMFNRFGLWRCLLFDNDGQYIPNQL